MGRMYKKCTLLNNVRVPYHVQLTMATRAGRGGYGELAAKRVHVLAKS